MSKPHCTYSLCLLGKKKNCWSSFLRLKGYFSPFHQEHQPRRSLVIYKAFYALYYFKCSSLLLGCFKPLAILSFWLCILLISSWILYLKFLNAISTLMDPQFSVLPLTFPWLGAFPLGLHKKGSLILYVCTKPNHFLPQTAPTTSWCSGGFAHWKCPWKIIFMFRHWYTGGKKDHSVTWCIQPFQCCTQPSPTFSLPGSIRSRISWIVWRGQVGWRYRKDFVQHSGARLEETVTKKMLTLLRGNRED